MQFYNLVQITGFHFTMMAFQEALDNLSIRTEFSAPGNFIVAYVSHIIPASVTRRKGSRALL